jgi:hypothetical protein
MKRLELKQIIKETINEEKRSLLDYNETLENFFMKDALLNTKANLPAKILKIPLKDFERALEKYPEFVKSLMPFVKIIEDDNLSEISLSSDAGEYDTPFAFMKMNEKKKKYFGTKDMYEVWPNKNIRKRKMFAPMDKIFLTTSLAEVINKNSEAEKYFELKRIQLNKAKSTSEMIEIMSSDIDKDIKGNYINTLKRELNVKFKGDLEKSRNYLIKKINIYEHDYFDLG